jgi:hypothetical protein
MRDDKQYQKDLITIIKTMKLAEKIMDDPTAYCSKEEWKLATKEFRKGMAVFTRRYFQLWD